MAKRYSDIIGVTTGRAAYNIIDERSGEWDGFIVNKRFDEILEQCVIPSVRNNNQAVHKPFWINGTYGSGKSHASAVIMHLLCDEVQDVKPFVDREYRDNESLRKSILSLREKKRLLPVCLYGLQNMVHEADLSLCIQAAVAKALAKIGLSLNVRTDAQCYLDSVSGNPDLWQSLIDGSANLKAHAPTLDSLKRKLASVDADVDLIAAMRDALREKKLDVRLDSAKLSDWIFEMQDALRAKAQQYNGFLFVWDEFTTVMQSAVSLNVLVALQEIAEKMSSPANDSYLLLIAHPSALDKVGEQEKEKTRGRYHYMHYNMETISAFKIMSRMFAPKDPDAIKKDADDFFQKNDGTVKFYVDSVDGKAGSRNDLQSLFPLHPGTANLASCFATLAGSSSRSVFEFITSPAVKSFLESEDAYAQKDVITADILWDFVLDAFNEDYKAFGVVTDKYNNYRKKAEEAGPDVAAVFKAILLLNALVKKDGRNPTIIPSEDNVRQLFTGSRYADGVERALTYIREKQIVQRDPSGIYSVQFAALDPKEVEGEREALSLTTYRTTRSIMRHFESSKEEFEKNAKGILRPCKIAYFSAGAESQPQISSMVDNEFAKTEPYRLRIAVFLSSNDEEKNIAKEYAAKLSADSKFETTIFVVCETVLGDDKRWQFIDYMANSKCAAAHGHKQNAEVNEKNAALIVNNWMNSIRVGLFAWFLNGKSGLDSGGKLSSAINKLSGYIYYLGPDALTFQYTPQQWRPTNAKKAARTIISANSLSDAIHDLGGGPDKIAGHVLSGAVSESMRLNDKCESHPLAEAKDFVNKQIGNIKYGDDFNLGELLKPLTQPPYGFYKSPAYMGMMAFIMRDYIDKFYDTKGQPHNVAQLPEDISEMFEAWEKNVRSSKLQFSQESGEARAVSALISEVFALKDAKSLKDARWGLKDYCNKAGFPLWILSFAPEVEKDDVRQLIDKLADLQQNDQAAKDAVGLAQLLQLFEKYRYELSNVLSSDDSFLRGFCVYAKKIDDTIDAQDCDAVRAFVNENMEGEAGLWTREKLKEVIQRWHGEKVARQERSREARLASLIAESLGSTSAVYSLEEASDRLRKHSKEIGFPLWILVYSHDASSGHVKDLIYRLSNLTDSPMAGPEEVTSTLGLMEECQDALKDVLTNPESFRQGFDAFVMAIERANVKRDEVVNVYNYVKSNEPEDPCLWTKHSVENAVLRWRMDSVAQPDENRRQMAIRKVGELGVDALRSLVKQMCEQGDAATIDFILKN